MTLLTTVRKLSEAKAKISRLLAKTLYKNEVSQRELSRITERSPSIIHRMCDPTRPETITLADLIIEDFPDEVFIALVTEVLDARGYTTPVKKSIMHSLKTTEGGYEYLTDLIRLFGDVVQAWNRGVYGAWIHSFVRRFLETSRQLHKHLTAGEEHVKAMLPPDDGLRRDR